MIIIFDQKKYGKLVLSRNSFRYLLDGLTFATGLTVVLAILEPSLFVVVASNTFFITVTATVCTVGPLVNLAERYGRVVD